MAIPSKTIWKLDSHTVAKHEILRRYLQRWFPILESSYSKVIYIDGFCGPGRYEGGEQGSPLVVLDLAVNHATKLRGEIIFFFIEERIDRIEHLRSEIKNLILPSNFTVRTWDGEFAERFKQILDRIDEKQMSTPTFIFIDPFGFSGVPFDLIERALQKPRSEVFINFMVDSINRWLTHPDETIHNHICDIFGTTECFEIANKSSDRVGALRDLYQTQLKKTAKFVRYFEMRDENNKPQYYLFFASNHPLGHLKMKEAMWGVDPQGNFRFSDATNQQQQIMFDNFMPDFLWNDLFQKFRGQKVLTETIIKFVEDETPYLGKHARQTLKEYEERESYPKIQVSSTKANGDKRKKGSFPEGVPITFPS